MANNPKKGPFDLSIDLDKIPGYRARFPGGERFVDGINPEMTKPSEAGVVDSTIGQRIGSNQNVFSNPSIILRRKGLRVR